MERSRYLYFDGMSWLKGHWATIGRSEVTSTASHGEDKTDHQGHFRGRRTIIAFVQSLFFDQENDSPDWSGEKPFSYRIKCRGK